MKKGLILGLLSAGFSLACVLLLQPKVEKNLLRSEDEEEESGFYKSVMQAERAAYEYNMLKDPRTGKIPDGIWNAELREAQSAPMKPFRNANDLWVSEAGGTETTAGASNNWQEAGPYNVGGRTRVIVFDTRYNGTTNRVILAGSVSSGVMRTEDGGNTWTRVGPDQQIHSLTSLAQDPRPGFQDTWYAGTGEALGNSTSGTGAFYLGHGIFKSTDNGKTWTPLTSTQGGSLTSFDNAFDLVHKIVVNPANGDIYAACQNTIQRSQNGGTSWTAVMGALGGSSATGNTDVVINSTGTRIYAAFHSRNTSNRGVWASTTGNSGAWTLLGGNANDTPTGWIVNESTTATWGRILLHLVPGSENTLYAIYENGKSQASPTLQPELDIFRCNVSDIANPVWTNRSSNAPSISGSFSNLRNPISLQGGYNMCVAIKPDDPRLMLIGGTVLFRSVDSFATNTVNWIGGYGFGSSSGSTNNPFGFYPNSHPDIHCFAFDPTNPKRLFCGNDGGIQVTEDITATPVVWTYLRNYQTLQYYHVAIDPESGKNNFFGGAQDNGSHYRDASLNMGNRPSYRPTINDHEMVGGGDGVSVDIGKIAAGKQPLYLGAQTGTMIRDDALNYFTTTQVSIRPPNDQLQSNPSSGYGEFVTVFKLSHANSEALFYVNYNRLFRTTQASTVTQTTSNGWDRMTGVENAVNAAGGSTIAIRTIDFSWGPYLSSHSMYLGTTNGKVYRLDDYLNASVTTSPIDITPVGLTGNVQDIAVNPNNDNEIMAVVSNYNATSVWWTRNAKAATPVWFNAEGNLTTPSVRSCVIVAKKTGTTTSSEYYIGTSVGLYSCENMGYRLEASQPITWTREAPALINFSVVTTMDYRPEDNVLLVGTHGNGMYFCELGGANFNPNNPTALNTIVNDKNFIRSIQPSSARGNFNYLVGNATGVRNMSVRVLDIGGQVVYQNNVAYADGTLPLQRFAAGTYVIEITSDNRKYRSLQKVIKN
ncbi:MAG TPA: hypothetical protein DIW54_09885 [Chitinophagaceae bacterium]|nr:hypothetical protein [Chitinophagaceae bacterium]